MEKHKDRYYDDMEILGDKLTLLSVSSSSSPPSSQVYKKDNNSNNSLLWERLLNDLKNYTENTLSFLSSYELDGNPNNGVTEVGLKLIIIAFLSSGLDTKCYKIESERTVEGGRIDLTITHYPSKSTLIIELKYIRVGFLEITKLKEISNQRQVRRLWENTNNALQKMTTDDMLTLRYREYFSGEEELVSLKTKLQDALKQVAKYSVKMKEEQNKKQVIDKDFTIFTTVIMGIGCRVIRSSLKNCTKNESLNNVDK